MSFNHEIKLEESKTELWEDYYNKYVESSHFAQYLQNGPIGVLLRKMFKHAFELGLNQGYDWGYQDGYNDAFTAMNDPRN